MIFTFEDSPKEVVFATLFSGGCQHDFPDAYEQIVYSDFCRDFASHRSPFSVPNPSISYPDFATTAIEEAEVWLREYLPTYIDVKQQFLRIMLEETGRQHFSELTTCVGLLETLRLQLIHDTEALSEFFLLCAEFSWGAGVNAA